MVVPWWRSAVLYQVYPRSFADSDGDGTGDLAGVRRHLDHLSWLGVDGVWLSPFYPSPMCDGGYDVRDYCDVDPAMGTLQTFDRLVAEAHERGLRVLIDWVPNHTSVQHPWFAESRSGPDSAKRDWYHWRDRPNNWRAAFHSGSAWTLDETTQQYYLHFFLPDQPDLNWGNGEVVAAMHDTLRFWLDRGVDGFRIDVAHCLGKDPRYADDDRCLASQPISSFNDQAHTHEILRGIRSVVDAYPGDRVIIGEVNIRSTATVVEYYGSGDELHLTFNFPPMDAGWDPVVWQEVIAEVERRLSGEMAWPVWVLSNHDNSRVRTRYGGSLDRARAAALLLLTLRGTAFVYQGEELGLEDVDLRRSEWTDPGGRDGPRAPIPWTAQPPHGWPGARPWLPFPPDPATGNAASQREDPGSIACLYRRLIAERHDSQALSRGDWQGIATPPGLLGYRRLHAGDERLILINFADKPKPVDLIRPWRIRIDTQQDDDSGRPFTGTVRPHQGLLLAPDDGERVTITARG